MKIILMYLSIISLVSITNLLPAQSRINIVVELNGCVESNVSGVKLLLKLKDNDEQAESNVVHKVNYRVGEITLSEEVKRLIVEGDPDAKIQLQFDVWNLVDGFVEERAYQLNMNRRDFQQAYLHIKIFDLSGKQAIKYEKPYLWEYATDYYTVSNVPPEVKSKSQQDCP